MPPGALRLRRTRRAIILLIVVNTLLWAGFALSGGRSRVSAGVSGSAGRSGLSPR
jgi:hypothetical protein